MRCRHERWPGGFTSHVVFAPDGGTAGSRCSHDRTWDHQHMVPGLPVFSLPEGVVLLDVRENDEWWAGHAPQAVHIPMGQVPLRLDEILAAFPDPPVHVVCRSGIRSAQITAYLVAQGVDAVNVEGGMESWLADGRPLVAETSAPPTVI